MHSYQLYLRTLCIALGVFLPDILTKWLIRVHLELWTLKPILPGFFNLSHVRNKGSAFGFLNNTASDWQVPLLIGINIVSIMFLLSLLRASQKPRLVFVSGIGLILGGALGNLVDRIRHGYVTDFLDFYLGSWHWPSFNIADMGITIGAAFLVLAYLREGHTNASDTL